MPSAHHGPFKTAATNYYFLKYENIILQQNDYYHYVYYILPSFIAICLVQSKQFPLFVKKMFYKWMQPKHKLLITFILSSFYIKVLLLYTDPDPNDHELKHRTTTLRDTNHSETNIKTTRLEQKVTHNNVSCVDIAADACAARQVT